MPSLNPFSSVKGKNNCTLFEIRLDNDFIVFRGGEHESAGQMLRGVVVLCLSAPLKVEDIRLRLSGTLRFSWTDTKVGPGGVPNQKIDRQVSILEHRWSPFVGGYGKSITLPEGNYEWPFEYMLPGSTAESVEGIPEASITYRLKVTATRGKLAHDIHAYKHLRVIRTLEPAALEFLHAMSVENTWPNKVDYSIVLPQKAVVFGAAVMVEMRFTPLLKGLEMGRISAKMVEIRECSVPGANTLCTREHRVEREVASWRFEMTREENWRDIIDDSGQDGWVMNKKLSLPKRLRQCIQDLNHHGIKVRHKIKLTVSLKNPDGHVSELRATLPISIFISPNMPLDEHGDLVDQSPGGAAAEAEINSIAPPGYGEHLLDQLYEDVDMSGFRTPGAQSGNTTPYLARSRAASSENLPGISNPIEIPPSTLSSMLLSLPPESTPSNSPRPSSMILLPSSVPSSSSSPTLELPPTSHPLSRTSSQDNQTSGRNSPEHVDYPDLSDLNKVPSYATAVKTPARCRAYSGGVMLPDYNTALNGRSTPAFGRAGCHDRPATSMATSSSSGAGYDGRDSLAQLLRVPRTARARPASVTSLLVQRLHYGVSGGGVGGGGEDEEQRAWHLLQGRERIV